MISCVNKKSPKELFLAKRGNKTLSDKFDIDWTKYAYEDAKIVSWNDGDTPRVETLKNHKNVNVRIKAIDTPEAHERKSEDLPWTSVEGPEFKLAELSWRWAEKKFPAGTIVRISTTREKSYDRITGNLFFNETEDEIKNNKFNHWYSLDIIKKGWAFPLVSSWEAILDSDINILKLTALRFADAFNTAFYNKKGIFSDKNMKIMKKGVHAFPNYMPSIYDEKMDRLNAETNIYYLSKVLPMPQKQKRRRRT